MSNKMRIVRDNIAQQANSINADSEAGALIAGNLLTDIKSQVWRSNTTSAVITLEWTEPQFISFVGFVVSSFMSTATTQVQLYTETTDITPVHDSGAVLCCPPKPFGQIYWGIFTDIGLIGGCIAVCWYRWIIWPCAD